MVQLSCEAVAVQYNHIRYPDFKDYPIAVRPLPESEKDTDSVAAYLAKPLLQAECQPLHPIIEDDVDLLNRAVVLRESLSSELERLAGDLDKYSILSMRRCVEQAEKGDPGILERAGLKVDYEWLPDIIRTILRGRPIEVEVATSTVPRLEKDGDDFNYVLNFSDVFSAQKFGLSIGSILRSVNGFEHVRPVVLVEDRLYSSEHFALNGLHRGMAIRTVYDRLLNMGVFRQIDRPGEDFSIIPLSRAEENVEAVIKTLKRTETGTVISNKDGTTRFRPFPRLADGIARQYSASATEPLYRDGVLLQDPDGTPSDVAVRAATYLESINTSFTHLRFHGRFLEKVRRFNTTEEQALSIVLQAMDRVYSDRDHHIYHDPISMPLAEATYALVYMLHREIRRVITSAAALSSVDKAMIPLDYFKHNYGSKSEDTEDGEEGCVDIWPEDLQNIKTMATEMPFFYSPGEVSSAAVFGYGPFTFNVLPLASLMKEGAIIDISDLLPENIAFAKEWFEGNPGVGSYDLQEATYERFAQEFQRQAQDGEFFADCKERLRRNSRLHAASMESLDPNSVQLLLESFVSCSRNIEKYGFYEAVRQKARILKWDNKSMMISTHMVKSGGWNNSGDDEGVLMPAAKLSIDDIRAAYECAGLEVVRCVPLRSDDAIREDYEGMVVIFARPARHVRPHSLAV